MSPYYVTLWPSPAQFPAFQYHTHDKFAFQWGKLQAVRVKDIWVQIHYVQLSVLEKNRVCILVHGDIDQAIKIISISSKHVCHNNVIVDKLIAMHYAWAVIIKLIYILHMSLILEKNKEYWAK